MSATLTEPDYEAWAGQTPNPSKGDYMRVRKPRAKTVTLYIPALTEEMARKVVRADWPRLCIRSAVQEKLGIWRVKAA